MFIKMWVEDGVAKMRLIPKYEDYIGGREMGESVNLDGGEITDDAIKFFAGNDPMIAVKAAKMAEESEGVLKEKEEETEDISDTERLKEGEVAEATKE